MSFAVWNPLCAICREPVNLTEGKTDEDGRAVHEECYVAVLVTKNTRRHTARISPMRSLRPQDWAYLRLRSFTSQPRMVKHDD